MQQSILFVSDSKGHFLYYCGVECLFQAIHTLTLESINMAYGMVGGGDVERKWEEIFHLQGLEMVFLH